MPAGPCGPVAPVAPVAPVSPFALRPSAPRAGRARRPGRARGPRRGGDRREPRVQRLDARQRDARHVLGREHVVGGADPERREERRRVRGDVRRARVGVVVDRHRREPRQQVVAVGDARRGHVAGVLLDQAAVEDVAVGAHVEPARRRARPDPERQRAAVGRVADEEVRLVALDVPGLVAERAAGLHQPDPGRVGVLDEEQRRVDRRSSRRWRRSGPGTGTPGLPGCPGTTVSPRATGAASATATRLERLSNARR